MARYGQSAADQERNADSTDESECESNPEGLKRGIHYAFQEEALASEKRKIANSRGNSSRTRRPGSPLEGNQQRQPKRIRVENREEEVHSSGLKPIVSSDDEDVARSFPQGVTPSSSTKNHKDIEGLKKELKVTKDERDFAINYCSTKSIICITVMKALGMAISQLPKGDEARNDFKEVYNNALKDIKAAEASLQKLPVLKSVMIGSGDSEKLASKGTFIRDLAKVEIKGAVEIEEDEGQKKEEKEEKRTTCCKCRQQSNKEATAPSPAKKAAPKKAAGGSFRQESKQQIMGKAKNASTSNSTEKGRLAAHSSSGGKRVKERTPSDMSSTSSDDE